MGQNVMGDVIAGCRHAPWGGGWGRGERQRTGGSRDRKENMDRLTGRRRERASRRCQKQQIQKCAK